MIKRTFLDKRKIMLAARKGGYRAIQKAAILVKREMMIILSKGGGQDHIPAALGQPPHRQRGELRSSVQHAMIAGERPGCVIGATARYAGILNWGTKGKGGKYADIVPKKAKALTIPVSRFAYGKRARDITEKLRFVPLKHHGGLIGLLVRDYKYVRRKGQSIARNLKEAEVMFQLVTKVAIAPHPFAKRALFNCKHQILGSFRNMLRV